MWSCLGNNYKLKNKIKVRDQGYVQDYDVARLKRDYSTSECCGASYHLLGYWISQDSKIRFQLQVESYIRDWRFSKSRLLGSYVSHHTAMAYDIVWPDRFNIPCPNCLQWQPFMTNLELDGIKSILTNTQQIISKQTKWVMWYNKKKKSTTPQQLEEDHITLMTMRHIKAVHSKSNERQFTIECVMDDYKESNATIRARHPKLFKDATYKFEASACPLTSLMG